MEKIDKKKATEAWIEMKTFSMMHSNQSSFSPKDINERLQKCILTLDSYFMEKDNDD